MADIKRVFIDTEFGQMHLRMAGTDTPDALPLMCLHMAPQSGRDFEAFMKLAGERRLVVAPDYHGYGESAAMQDDRAVTIENYAYSIWQALDELSLEQVDILGYHTGSKVGVEMALQSPDRVKMLTCLALSTMTPEQYANTAASFKPISSQDEFSKWWRDMKEYFDPNMPYEELVQKYAISLKSGSKFHLGFKASFEYNEHVIEKLKALKTPIAIINLDDDLRDVTPIAANYIRTVELVDKADWKPGFLELKPSEVLQTLNAATETLFEKNHNAEASLGS